MKIKCNNKSNGKKPLDIFMPSGNGSSPDVKCSSQPSQRAFYYLPVVMISRIVEIMGSNVFGAQVRFYPR